MLLTDDDRRAAAELRDVLEAVRQVFDAGDDDRGDTDAEIRAADDFGCQALATLSAAYGRDVAGAIAGDVFDLFRAAVRFGRRPVD